MVHKVKVKLKQKHIKKLQEYFESNFYLNSFIHKTVNNDLARKIEFHSDYIIIDQYSGVKLDSNFLAISIMIFIFEILKNWINPFVFIKNLLRYILIKRWEFKKYIKHYDKLWPKENTYYIHSKKIKDTFKFLHYERLLAYNYFNEFSNYLYDEFSLKKQKN